MSRTLARYLVAVSLCWLPLFLRPLPVSAFIAGVSLDRGELNQAAGDTVTLQFTLEADCAATLFVTDAHGHLVRTFYQRQTQLAGTYQEVWDGRDDYGNPVIDGIYFPIIRCLSSRQGVAAYNPTAFTWGRPVVPQGVRYDADQQQLHFSVPTRAYGRLRVGLQEGGPIYKTLAGWRLWRPGEHQLSWDGRDQEGYQRVVDQELFAYSFDFFSLPPTTVVVSGSSEAAYLPQPDYQQYRIQAPGGMAPFYATYASAQAAEPVLQGQWQGVRYRDQRPVLRGQAVYQVWFAEPAHRSSRLGSGSELVLYVNDVFVAETPVEGLPARIVFATDGFANGSHRVTINLFTNDDRAGIIIDQVIIEN